jgi:hypothetical protein
VTELLKHFDNIVGMDWQTLAVICLLCGVAAYFLKEYLANPPMIIFVYPLLVLLSILVQYGFLAAEIFPPKKLDQWLMWTILASICGTIAGTVIVAVVIVLREGGLRRSA